MSAKPASGPWQAEPGSGHWVVSAPDMDEANARLITAAPEYHLAAHVLLTKLSSLSKHPVEAWPLLTPQEIREIVLALMEAKEKAEGLR